MSNFELKLEIQKIKETFLQEIAMNEGNIVQVEKLHKKYLGKKGLITSCYKSLSKLSLEDKKEIGIILINLKKQMENLLQHEENFQTLQDVSASYPDTSLPSFGTSIGSFHPITLTLQEIASYFSKLGFHSLEVTKELDSTFHNFDSLNIPSDHPARASSDTFYIDKEHILRTHTSNVQYEIMQTYNPPYRFIVPGCVYRRDYDATHTPMFTQVECLLVDDRTNWRELIAITQGFLHYYFGDKVITRVRPSYFPFTSPSMEIDVFYHGKWVEILGGGCVHPHVLENASPIYQKVDGNPKLQGIAFAMGVERLVMLKYKLTNLRSLFLNDLRFLNQYK